MAEQQDINVRKLLPVFIIVGGVIFLLIFWNSMTVTIDAGEAGVLFKRFGGGVQTDKTYQEGFHFISPWNSMYKYEARQQEVAEDMNVLSSNGLDIKADVSIWYQPIYNEVGLLHQNIGPRYLNVIIIPALRSAARSVFGRYAPEQIYSSKRDIIQDEIFEETKRLLESKHVQVNEVLIRSVVLPSTIKQAIEGKLKQEQESLEYEFRLEKAEKEAQRQEIEATGKANANRILSASLTDKILRDKGIEATLRLAESPNSKVVIVGNADNGLPIILGGNN